MTLLDLINRHQILIEGVKNWHVSDAAKYLRRLVAELNGILRSLSVEKLSDLALSAFQKLMAKVRALEERTLTSYGNEFLKKLRAIVQSDVAMQRLMFSEYTGAPVPDDLTFSRAWKATTSKLIPSDGVNLKLFVQRFAAQAMEQIELVIRQGYASALPIEEIVRSVIGSAAAKFKDGALGRVFNAAKSMVATAIQHATTQVADMMSETVSDQYQWISVIDSATSDVCRSRNGQIYTRGEGPLPPAHRHCRSRTIPIERGQGPTKPPTFARWLRDQSPEFLSDTYGEAEAAAIRGGKADSAKYAAFSSERELTLAQFEARTKLLFN